jgi:hypothetical protein
MAWIPFRAVHFSDTTEILSRIWTLSDGVSWLHIPTMCTLIAAVVWHIAYITGVRSRLAAFIPAHWLYILEVMTMITLLLLFAPMIASPFIYFQF